MATAETGVLSCSALADHSPCGKNKQKGAKSPTEQNVTFLFLFLFRFLLLPSLPLENWAWSRKYNRTWQVGEHSVADG